MKTLERLIYYIEKNNGEKAIRETKLLSMLKDVQREHEEELQQVKSVDLADVVGLLPFSEPEELASWMHNTYEDVAVSEGWDTQDNCKVDFSKLPNENKQTMIEVARRILELRK